MLRLSLSQFRNEKYNLKRYSLETDTRQPAPVRRGEKVSDPARGSVPFGHLGIDNNYVGALNHGR